MPICTVGSRLGIDISEHFSYVISYRQKNKKVNIMYQGGVDADIRPQSTVVGTQEFLSRILH